MKVIVSSGVVSSLRESDKFFKLMRLFAYSAEGRHHVLFQDQEELAEFLSDSDSAHRRAYERAIGTSARAVATLAAGASTVVITPNAARNWSEPVAHLDIDAAIEFLDEPLAVVVENAATDWQFLLKLLAPSRRAEIQTRAERNWILPIHSGGADLPTRLAERRVSEPKRIRTFCVFDSDRRHPDELHSNWQPGDNEQCAGYVYQQAASNGFAGRFWMLQRRSIESYMPRSELAGVAAGDVIDAFFRLSSHGRWYFNMKRGFNGDKPVENRHRCKDLYVGVPVEDQAALATGFGKGLADRYSTAKPEELAWDTEAVDEARIALEALFLLV